MPRRRDDRLKPPPFEYHAPATVDEVCALLGSLEDAKVLAGGQSLIPLLNFRLARPSNLVDINRIGGLDRIYERDGGLAVQALARQAAVEDSDLVAGVGDGVGGFHGSPDGDTLGEVRLAKCEGEHVRRGQPGDGVDGGVP